MMYRVVPLACFAAASPGLDALNSFRAANGKGAVAECSSDAFAGTMATYDAKNGNHAYVTKNGWDGACTKAEGSPEGCETGGGATNWADAISAMGASCLKQLTGDSKCAAFGMCTDCHTSASGKTHDFFVANLCRPSAPINGTGLDAINAYRTKNGKAALAMCADEQQAKAQQIADYDGPKGAGAYIKDNGGDPKGWTGVCDAAFVGQEEECETNGYNGGNDGLTWENAVKAMETSCPTALTGNHKCASFGSCQGCSKSKSGKPRNWYTSNFC